jgi:signal transduction histidine kinase
MLCYWKDSKLIEDKVKQDCCRLGEGISGRTAELNSTIVLNDIAEDTRVSDADSRLGKDIRAFASTPLRSKEKLLGVLNIASNDTRKFSREDVHFLEGVARQVAISLENARLHQEVQDKEEIRGELLNELLSIQEEERKRIAQELHDETSQVLASLNARLEAASKLLPTGATKVKDLLRNAQAQSVTLIEDIHKLIYELRPTLLDDLGLLAATRWLLENTLEATGMNVNFQSIGRKRRLSPPIETTLFRVTQEAISNIIKHAESKNVTVIITFKRDSIVVSISDDGKGFDVADVLKVKDRPRGLGLLGMKERVERFHGKFVLKSGHRKGTEVYIEIPVDTGGKNEKDKDITGR